MPKKGLFLDLAGMRFGTWTVLKFERYDARGGQTVWLCRCDCGTIRPVRRTPLRTGRSTNCGCLQRKAQSLRKTRHGMKGTGAWNSWMAMRKRCRDPNNVGWRNYGARGIRVCEEWDKSFEAFWRDMGVTWAPGLTIERIDVNGNYEPGNCEWIPLAEQLRNRRPFSEWHKPGEPFKRSPPAEVE